MIVPSYYLSIIIIIFIVVTSTAALIWNRIATRQYADALRHNIQFFRELQQERDLLPEEMQELREDEDELLRIL